MHYTTLIAFALRQQSQGFTDVCLIVSNEDVGLCRGGFHRSPFLPSGRSNGKLCVGRLTKARRSSFVRVGAALPNLACRKGLTHRAEGETCLQQVLSSFRS